MESLESMDQKTIARLQRGWDCITQDQMYLNVCRSSIKTGAGINFFKFLRVGIDKGPSANCEYYYWNTNSTVWEEVAKNFPKIMKIYDHPKNMLICVSVPMTYEDDDIQKIGVFDCETGKEMYY